jgi:hypothetical protein
MIKKIEFHTKLKFEKSAYLKKTISFKLERKQIKISELKNLASVELKENEMKLKGLRDDLKAMQARVKQQFENGRLGQLSIVKNKALLIKGLIKETIKTIQAEKDGNFGLNNLDDDVKKLYLDYAKQNDLEKLYKKGNLVQKIGWQNKRKRYVKELESLLKKSEAANKLLSTGSDVRIELPSIDGLEIPEGIFCDQTSGVFLNCWYTNY